MVDVLDHFAEHSLSVDPHDPIDRIELAERGQDGRRFVAAIVSVRMSDGVAYNIRASGPEVVGPLGALAGPNRGYVSLEWDSVTAAPEPIAELLAASGVLRSAVSS